MHPYQRKGSTGESFLFDIRDLILAVGLTCRQVTEYMRSHEMQGATVVLMAFLNEIVAAFAIKDPIKPEASAVIKALGKNGIKVD